jgi:hypothetical protein
MKEFYIKIMSIDPDDHYGREQGDDHQKYGFTVQANTEKEAMDKATREFKERHGNLPIYWVKAFCE